MSRESRPSTPTLSRRGIFAGAGAAGALAAVAVVAPRLEPAVPETAPEADRTAEADGRYQLTEHVNRYYQTARV
jgi:hypothetical protein